MPRFRTPDLKQRLMLPISLEEQIVPGTLEFAIHDVVEHRLDLTPFHARFRNDKTGRPAIDPKILLKVVLLGYSRGLVGSRRIERACHENIIFIAMTGDDAPDHSTIAEFISSMGDQIRPLFIQVLMVCEEMNLLGGTLFALDGCKLPGNASKKWSGTLPELREKQTSLEKKIERLMDDHIQADRKDQGTNDDDSPLNHRKRQIERLQQQADKIDRFLADAKERIGKQNKEIKSNITDPDSAKMKTSHGTIQGFNAQAVVDHKHQIIVAGIASGEGQDQGHAAVVLPLLQENLKALGYHPQDLRKAAFLADSGYFSVTNLEACAASGMNTVIPDPHFRMRDTRLSNQKKHQPKGRGKFALNQFRYDPSSDTYICPAGERLHSYAKQTLCAGRRCRMYVGTKEICGPCRLRSECMIRQARRRTLMIPLQNQPLPITDLMRRKIDTPDGRRLYERRMGTVEPVFANLVENKHLKRFTLRGVFKATTQWLLWCIVHNLEKIGNYGYAL